ncbi:MAG: IS200/IS605 family transposase [Acidobacteria bacterium]|nr:IS200/IS605 family transposase [Acidobacteriota bacterium]
MSQSLSKMWCHLIFSTKDRYPFLTDRVVRQHMHAYMASILREHDSPALIIGGVADHVHALLLLSKNLSIAKVVFEVKRSSSKWIKTQGPAYGKFHWQNGYGSFSVSQSHVEQVRGYISTQESHHKRVTFKDEYIKFLKKYEVAYDEKYVWD